MTLDLRTIVVLLMASAVLMSLTLAVGIHAGRGKGFAKWNAGLALYALGWLLMAGRATLPQVVSVALADALLVAGICIQLGALAELGGAAARRLLLVVPGPLVFVLTLPLLDDYAALTLLVSVANAGVLGAMAVRAIRLGKEFGPARWLLAGACSAGAVMLPLRAADIWRNPALYPGVFSNSTLHTATFIVLFVITIVTSVSFLLMHRERAEGELRRLAAVDSLTGLFNRRALGDLAERAGAHARRNHSSVGVLMMDLDHFKRVNDEFGHLAGDRVLADFAAATKASLRTEDLVCRYGGEEFCAILPGATMELTVAIAERLRRAVSERPLGGLPRVVTVSIGAALYRGAAGETLDAVIGRADEALYRAKAAGRDRVMTQDSAASTREPLAA